MLYAESPFSFSKHAVRHMKSASYYQMMATHKIDHNPWQQESFHKQLEMWANAQPDGRPAKYRWRPLLNAAVWLMPTSDILVMKLILVIVIVSFQASNFYII